MTTFLGIDLGSTTIKGAMLDLERRSVETVRMRPFPGPIPGRPPSHFEIDPQAVVDGTRAVLSELLECADQVQGIVDCISHAVEQTADSDLNVNLAFFAGSLGDRGHIDNIRLDNLSVGHVFRAAFEHMAENYVQCAARLSPEKKWRQVVFSGGLPQKFPSLRRMIAERLACPVRSVDIAEETLEGLLRLARRIMNVPEIQGE